MRNKLIVIGWMSDRIAYLNVPRDEAIRRFRQESNIAPDFDIETLITEFSFDEEFEVYDAWEKE